VDHMWYGLAKFRTINKYELNVIHLQIYQCSVKKMLYIVYIYIIKWSYKSYRYCYCYVVVLSNTYQLQLVNWLTKNTSIWTLMIFIGHSPCPGPTLFTDVVSFRAVGFAAFKK
jgi:hypothetical protein